MRIGNERTMQIKYLTVLIPLMLVLSAAQALPTPAQDKPGCATVQSKKLGFLVGRWNVKSRFRISRREDKWEQTTAFSVIDDQFRDCLYREILTGERNNRPLKFIGLYSYSNVSNRMQWVGGHSEHGILTMYEGRFVDGSLILENETEIGGRKFYFRRVVTRTNKGFKVRSERSTDGKAWDAGWFLEYERRIGR